MLKCERCKKEYKTLKDIKVKNIKTDFSTLKVCYFCECGENLGEVK